MADPQPPHLTWQCRAAAPGEFADPSALPEDGWIPAPVPGTAALATGELNRDYDAQDWWFRTRLPAREGPHLLTFDGLATVADVWLGGSQLLHSESMFARHAVRIDSGEDDVTIRCAALTPLLAARRPRPRWKTRLVAQQNLRWFRTTLLGRIPGWAPGPAPVGPWRPSG